jgi:hypothetical protein
MFTDYNLAPRPSGNQNGKKMKKSPSLTSVVGHQQELYDKVLLAQATTPMGKSNPDVLEVLTRRRNKELEQKYAEQQFEMVEQKRIIAEQAEELQKAWVEKDEILDELETTKHDFSKLGKNYHALNQTVQDLQFGINDTTMFADETQELNLQNHEHSIIAQMKEEMQEQQAKITYSNSSMICMKAEFNEQHELARAKINTLQFELNETAQALEESKQTIAAKINLNKTISEEKTRFEILSEEYQDKVLHHQSEITKIEGQQVLQQIDYEEKMECLRKDISKSTERLSYWQKQAEKRSEKINILSKTLNMERAQRVSSSNLYRKTSINMKLLAKKNQQIEAERNEFFDENRYLQRELASSRLEIRDYEERRKLSSAQKLFGKCFGKY